MHSVNRNNKDYPLGPANSKGFGVLGRDGSGISLIHDKDGQGDITSNLAYDKYLGLLAYGTRSGHIKMQSLKGYEQELYWAHQGVPVDFLLFVPGKLLLISIDAQNRLAIKDLRTINESNSNLDFIDPHQGRDTPDFQEVANIKMDKVSCLYMAPFKTSEDQNHNHVFIGMNSGKIHIYDIENAVFSDFVINGTEKVQNRKNEVLN